MALFKPNLGAWAAAARPADPAPTHMRGRKGSPKAQHYKGDCRCKVGPMPPGHIWAGLGLGIPRVRLRPGFKCK